MMLKESQKQRIKSRVIQAYENKYPDWKGLHVSDIQENKLFGMLVSVASDDYEDGEICIFRSKDEEVFIFDSTPQLLNHINREGSKIITYKEIIAFIIVIWMLVLFTLLVINRNENAIAIVTSSIAGILGTYVGIKIKDK